MISCPNCGAPFTPSLPDQTLCDSCSGLHKAEESSPLRETQVGGYRLVHELGSGRFSTSWLAEPEGGGGVVLKLLRAYAPDGETVQRFLDEARRLAGPGPHESPVIARIMEAGVRIGSALFLVYESGGELTMADELRGRGRMLPGRALELCAQLCEGLHVLHAAGLRHLGIKPANIGLAKDDAGSESAVLLDAYTAHLLSHSGLRETGLLPLATAAYLSPEEAAGLASDGRADLYGVGVLLFQLISGRLPIMGSTSEELLEAHRSQRALRLRDVGRKVNGEVEAIVARLLAKEPAARFADGRAAAEALRAAAPLADEAPSAEAEEEVEDPVPITTPAPLLPSEPEVEPPKPIEPGLEEAMLGRVTGETAPVRPAQRGSPAAAQASPAWWPAFFPAWLRPLHAGAGLLVAAILVSGVVLLGSDSVTPRPKRERKKPAAVAQAVPAPAQAEPPVVEPPPAATPPPAPAPAPEKQAAAPAPAAKPKAKAKVAQAAAPLTGVKAQLADAQKFLAKGQPKPAMKLLFDALDQPDLADPDRAQATRLMAEAEVKIGNKPAAVEWYRKYLRLADAAERPRVVKLIQGLNH